jgi:hypothetical protein
MAGNFGQLAEPRHGIVAARLAVAVDHQPRIGLAHQGGVQMLGEAAGDAQGADVPGDVTRQLRLGHAEVA